jgi:hypothetical protein
LGLDYLKLTAHFPLPGFFAFTIPSKQIINNYSTNFLISTNQSTNIIIMAGCGCAEGGACGCGADCTCEGCSTVCL